MTGGSGPNGNVYVVAAARTPMGKFGGALSNVPAVQLGAVAIHALLHELRRREGRCGLATLCLGGGSVAAAFERV